jgi:hypothetical protein
VTATAAEREAYDGALAALALTEASVEDNPVNRNNILATTDAAQLVIGFVVLVGALRSSLAAEAGCTVEEIDDMLRTLYLTAGAL